MLPTVSETATSPQELLAELISMLPANLTGVAIVLHTAEGCEAYQHGLEDDEFAQSAMVILEHLYRPELCK